MDDFVERFVVLTKEAASFGINALVVVHELDRISYTDDIRVFSNGSAAIGGLGMAVYAVDYIKGLLRKDTEEWFAREWLLALQERV